MMIGIDCSQPINAHTAQVIAASGCGFAARYLVPAAYAWKRLTLAEAQAISNAGLQIVSVFETTASRALRGAPAGHADGADALREARAVGQPPGTAIYFAVDYDAQPADFDDIEAYLKAVATQISGYESGVYGSYAVVEEMAKRKVCRHFWQTYAWSRGKRSASANLYQYQNEVSMGGFIVDMNESYGGEGWWTLTGPKAPSMSAEDAHQIIVLLQAAWNAATTKADKDEYHRLANEIRKAAGLPVQ